MGKTVGIARGGFLAVITVGLSTGATRRGVNWSSMLLGSKFFGLQGLSKTHGKEMKSADEGRT